ncbi:MAG: T9SS type A sorting domain-containing protein [Ignavibacteriaceae bacterium]
MRRVTLFLFIIFSITSLYSQQFHSLDGIESPAGQTILIYRLGSDQYIYNPIYKFNVQSGYEKPIMDAHSILYPSGTDIKSIWDFEFFPNDTSNFIDIGDLIYVDYGSYIAKNDSVVFGYFSPFYKIDISKQNQQKVFVFNGSFPIRSWDGGLTFPIDSIGAITNFAPFALSDFDDQVMFGVDEFGNFARNAEVVDTSIVWIDQFFKMLFDANQFHIYRVNKTYGGYSLNVSNNKGNAFTWTKTYQSENPIYVAIDSTQSGVLYLADGRKIYKSINNGYDFVLYKSLPSKLVGIYKKPYSEIIYAASKRNIYKITTDSITIIKSLPISQDLFEFYPLAVGDYWIYKVIDWSYPYYDEDTYTRKVVSNETLSNNKQYFKIEEKYYNSPYTKFVYERIDTSSGMVYRFDSECSNPDSEKVIDDFNSEVGDSLLLQRYTMCWDSIQTYFSEESTLPVFSEQRETRRFDYNWLEGHTHLLAKGLGIINMGYGYDFGFTNYNLNGCVIDGEVYGDTTFTDVDDEFDLIPTEYKLEQNYPNPFNPSTIISYQLQKAGNVTLKVFDVLGREVATLVDEYRNAGSYEVEFNASSINHHPASGIYFYQLKAGEFVETKKMLLLK